MELVRYLHNLKERHRGCVVTIGNFDGVHLGHQAVIQRLNNLARKLELPAVVMIFEPQPLEFFSPDKAPPRLSSFREKVVWLGEHGIDRVICLRFQRSLAELSAAEFVERLLVEQVGARFVSVGDDFRFGKGRTGDLRLLQGMGQSRGFDAVSTETLMSGSERVSSSQIRLLLAAGDMDGAADLLGRPYSMIGRVIHGDKRGWRLGFPTANIAIKRSKPPLLGVFAVQAVGLDDGVHEGVANIGTRPVFAGNQILLEVHLLDFEGNIYGKHLQVNFMKRLRSEQKFESIADLQDQIGQDIEDARLYFKNKLDN
jgi:riboflavin kinase/FMN adenylyltransferase